MQFPIRSGKVMLTNPNCRNNQRQARAADIQRMPVKRRQTPRTIPAHSRIGQTQRKAQTRPHTFRMTPVPDKTA
jgi:hypothetical protein